MADHAEAVAASRVSSSVGVTARQATTIPEDVRQSTSTVRYSTNLTAPSTALPKSKTYSGAKQGVTKPALEEAEGHE